MPGGQGGIHARASEGGALSITTPREEMRMPLEWKSAALCDMM